MWRSAIEVEELERLLDTHQITFNVHNEPYPSFENRVLLHLAAGHLVITEPLSPSHGLEPGLDFVEVQSPRGAHPRSPRPRRALPRRLSPHPRPRPPEGRAVRASRVWPRAVARPLADLHAFGTHREVAAQLSGAATPG